MRNRPIARLPIKTNVCLANRLQPYSHVPRERNNRGVNRTAAGAYQGGNRRWNKENRPPRSSYMGRLSYANNALVQWDAQSRTKTHAPGGDAQMAAVSRRRGGCVRATRKPPVTLRQALPSHSPTSGPARRREPQLYPQRRRSRSKIDRGGPATTEGGDFLERSSCDPDHRRAFNSTVLFSYEA